MGVDRQPTTAPTRPANGASAPTAGGQAGRSENPEKLIAIVEDDPHLADLFSDILQQRGHQGNWRLHLFTDGQDAKNRLPTLGAHLILLDVGLPNLDGVSLYKILRGHSNTKHTPIIVITGSHDWQLHRMGLHTGLLLRKPFNVAELLYMVSALLDPPSSSSMSHTQAGQEDDRLHHQPTGGEDAGYTPPMDTHS